MELKPISDLIDPRTRVANIMSATGKYSVTFSGYVAFCVGGVLEQRRVHDMSYNHQYDTCLYVVYKKVNYALNLPCKPISGGFNVESLKV